MPRDATVRQQALGAPVYVVSALLDTQQQLLALHPDDSTAQQVRDAMQRHHDKKPCQPLWLGRHPSMPSHEAWNALIAKHPVGAVATLCTGFVVRRVDWVDVSIRIASA